MTSMVVSKLHGYSAVGDNPCLDRREDDHMMLEDLEDRAVCLLPAALAEEISDLPCHLRPEPDASADSELLKMVAHTSSD